MNEQIVASQEWWVSLLFFVAGHLGLVARTLFMFIKSGQRNLKFFDDYISDNSAVLLLGVIFYWIIAMLWAWTSLIGFLGGLGDSMGLIPGEINAWSAVIAFLSDIFFFLLIDKVGSRIGADKLSDKLSEAMPKLSKEKDIP